MDWFFLALLPPFLYGLNVVIDQFLVRETFQNPITYQAFSSFVCLPMMVALYLWDSTVLEVTQAQALMMLGGGVLYTIGCIPYLFALKQDDASICAPAFQTIIVVVYLLGVVFLGEVLRLEQLAYALIAILGSILIVWDVEARKFKLKTLGLVYLFVICVAIFNLVMRVAALEMSWLSATFWCLCAYFLVGVFEILFIRVVRADLINTLKVRSASRLYGWGFFQEFLDNTATAIKIAVLAIAPSVAMVSIVHNSVQPIFILLVGGALSILRPDIYDSLGMNKKTGMKILSMGLIVLGLYLLYRSG